MDIQTVTMNCDHAGFKQFTRVTDVGRSPGSEAFLGMGQCNASSLRVTGPTPSSKDEHGSESRVLRAPEHSQMPASMLAYQYSFGLRCWIDRSTR